MEQTTITLKITGQHVTRQDRPIDAAEVVRVTDAIKYRYKLGWAGVAALFGLQPNNGGAMNVKNWRAGKQAMPKGHYYTALHLLDEFRIAVIHDPKK